MIQFEKTNEVPIRLVFRGDSLPDFVKEVQFTDNDNFIVCTDNGKVIPLLDFVTGAVNCYDHKLIYSKIIDNYRNLAGAIPADFKFIRRILTN